MTPQQAAVAAERDKMIFSCGAGALALGGVVYWMLNAADSAAARADARERRRRLMDGL
jgi:hypothetical protein